MSLTVMLRTPMLAQAKTAITAVVAAAWSYPQSQSFKCGRERGSVSISADALNPTLDRFWPGS